jgi:hypothetical protein
MLNNHILQYVYGKVMYVNPFSKRYEQELWDKFEKEHNSDAAISKRHWEKHIVVPANESICYFAECAVRVKVLDSKDNWRTIHEDDVARHSKQKETIGWFYDCDRWHPSRHDVDESFNREAIEQYYENVVLDKQGVWNVTDEYGATQHIIKYCAPYLNRPMAWEVLVNAGMGKKPTVHTYDLPVTSYRQFREDMWRLGIDLVWKKGLVLNVPNLQWRHRNEPLLSHYVDIADNGVLLLNARNGVNTIWFNNQLRAEVDHRAKRLWIAGIPKTDDNQQPAHALYLMVLAVYRDFGKGLNMIRNTFEGEMNIGESDAMRGFLTELQRRLTMGADIKNILDNEEQPEIH